MKKDKGFSLVELLIVVAIILTIAAIAVPALLRSRIAANEASAVASVRAITTAEHAYAQMFPYIGYTCTLSDLGQPAAGQPIGPTAAGGILDSVLVSGVKQGYAMSISNCSGTPQSTYSTVAVPVTQGSTGVRSFCSDASGTIWFGGDGTAATCLTSGTVLQ